MAQQPSKWSHQHNRSAYFSEWKKAQKCTGRTITGQSGKKMCFILKSPPPELYNTLKTSSSVEDLQYFLCLLIKEFLLYFSNFSRQIYFQVLLLFNLNRNKKKRLIKVILLLSTTIIGEMYNITTILMRFFELITSFDFMPNNNVRWRHFAFKIIFGNKLMSSANGVGQSLINKILICEKHIHWLVFRFRILMLVWSKWLI